MKKQPLIRVDPESRSTMTTIGQSSHLVDKIEQAFNEITQREAISSSRKDAKVAVKKLKGQRKLETDDYLLLGVIVFLVSEGVKDKSFISTLFWIFMG